MRAGRKPSGPRIVESLEAPEDQKKKLSLILETVAGTTTIESASSQLNISATYFYELRARALQAALNGLEPRPLGRPRTASDAPLPEVHALEQQVNRLEVELEASRIREEIALVMPQVLAPKKKTQILDRVTFSRRRRRS